MVDLGFDSASGGASSLRLGGPPRQLSPELRFWAMQYGAVKFRWWLLAIIGVANMLGGVMFLSAYFASHESIVAANAKFDRMQADSRQKLDQLLKQPDLPDEARARIMEALHRLAGASHRKRSSGEWLLWGGIAWIALDVVMIGGRVWYTKVRPARRGRQLLALLEFGNIGRAQVSANQVDYSIRINGAPQRIVTLVVDGQQRQIKTFDNNYANLFPEGAVLEVLYASDASDLVFPVSGIPAI